MVGGAWAFTFIGLDHMNGLYGHGTPVYLSVDHMVQDVQGTCRVGLDVMVR